MPVGLNQKFRGRENQIPEAFFHDRSGALPDAASNLGMKPVPPFNRQPL